MRRFALLLLSAVAFVGLGVDADAATPKKRVVTKAKPIAKAPPPKPSGSSGFYVGINGGYNWGRATFSNPVVSNSIQAPSAMVGLTFGYNAQAGLVVFGLETDIDAAWLKSTNWEAAPCFGCETRLTYFGTVRGRLGYAMGQALPYFTGGLAYGGVKTGLTGGITSSTETKIGWTAGAGVEYAIADAWSVKGEYLYFDLDAATCPATSCGAVIDVHLRGNLFRAGLNYRF